MPFSLRSHAMHIIFMILMSIPVADEETEENNKSYLRKTRQKLLYPVVFIISVYVY